MKDNTLSTSETKKHLMSMVEKMKKVEKSLSGRDTMVPIRDGRLNISTKQRRKQLQASTRNSVSTLADHSILSPDYP